MLVTEVSLSESNNSIPHRDVRILTHEVLREEKEYGTRPTDLEFITLFKNFTKKMPIYN